MLTVNFSPVPSELRKFGFVCFVVFSILGAFIFWRKGVWGIPLGEASVPSAAFLWGVGVLSAVFSLFSPIANRPLYVGLVVVTYPIGWTVSHVVLLFLFYGLITPVGLVCRLLRRDPLRRRFRPEAETYWERYRRRRDKSSYLRQY